MLFDTLAERGIINIYEILISLVVFEPNSEFEDKALMVFKAFDIDGGGTLDKEETSKFLLCGINGLCKMVGLSTPSRLGIKEFTHEQFKIIDEDGSGSIDMEEFSEWLSTTKSIQDFLCIYTGVQTHKFAQWRFKNEKTMWKTFFDDISFNYYGTRYCEIELLIKGMDKELQHIDKDVRAKLYYLFDYNGGTIVSEKQFIEVMAIWSVFSANDINNDNELDSHEVKQLFWLFDGKKPAKEKI